MAYRDRETTQEVFLAQVVRADITAGRVLMFVESRRGYIIEGWEGSVEKHLPAAPLGEDRLGPGRPS